jgi:16S rRNA (guanine527-N7)-methyltransferase
MDPNRIAELLRPFLTAKALPVALTLSSAQLQSISIYVGLLLRWNARINLTAVRDSENIVTRHFGESLFLAACLFPGSSLPATNTEAGSRRHALDLGSGAGFPGIPLKIYAPDLRLTLVESNRRKAAFLAEAIRALQLQDTFVFSAHLNLGQAKQIPAAVPQGIEPASLITMRAVERFDSALHTAAALVRFGAARFGNGRLALLIGRTQAEQVPVRIQDFSWETPILVPQSRERVLLVGRYPVAQVPGS